MSSEPTTSSAGRLGWNSSSTSCSARTAQIAAGGGERAIERHRSRGKLLARERIDRLIDPGTAFLELNALAAWDVYDGQAPERRASSPASASSRVRSA